MKVALFALIGSFVPLLAFARFDASADPTTISEADTIRLTLRADSTSITSNPDFDPLTKEFDILSDQRSAQIQSFNGQVDATTTWTLLLKPKHTGTLQIPAITLGSETTRPIEITVKELDPQLRRAIAQTVFFETAYTPKQVYVQSQVVVTRRLFYVNGAQLYGDMPNTPEIPGAMVKLLGESEHSTAVRDGRQYGMIEQRFAVFPERSGDLTIPAATVTGSVRLADSGIGRRIGVDVSSDTLKVTVLPIPAEYPRDAPWLPATDVELLEDWPGEPERGLATGTPSQRTLIVRADGNASSAIPPLAVALPDSLKAYPEPAKLERDTNPWRHRRNQNRIDQPGRDAARRHHVTRGARDVVGHRQPTGSHGRATGTRNKDHRRRDLRATRPRSSRARRDAFARSGNRRRRRPLPSRLHRQSTCGSPSRSSSRCSAGQPRCCARATATCRICGRPMPARPRTTRMRHSAVHAIAASRHGSAPRSRIG